MSLYTGKKRKTSTSKKRPFKEKKVFFFLIITSLSFFVISCSSMKDFSEIDNDVYLGDFSQAREHIEEHKDSLYAGTDKVLYGLDSGLLSHYEGNYESSNLSLSETEKLIEEYFAVSVTQQIGSYLLNDNIIDYAGEDFEDIYTNLFMALNYIQLGKTEDAFVEIRRFNNKLQLLSTKYAPALEQARLQTSQQGYSSSLLSSSSYSNETLEFHDSAFARYVSLLLYRSIGQMDSAEIDRKFIETAFSTQAQLYPFPVPNAVQEEFSIPNDKERLNIFCYTGNAPQKTEVVVRLPGIVENTWFKLAIPVMEKTTSSVSSIVVSATDSNGNTFSETLEVLESVENIAIDTFQQKQGLIYLKALLRSISKTAVNVGVTTAMQQSGAGGGAELFSLFASLFTELSEQADVRASRYFPALVWVGGLNLEEGIYDVTVTCYDIYNNVVHKQFNEKTFVNANNVNLVEAICLK